MPDDLEFEQAMKVYEELLEENLEEDEIYDKLWDHALHCMIDYGSLRHSSIVVTQMPLPLGK